VFLVGVALVLLSVFMYGRALDSRRLQLAAQRALKVRGGQRGGLAGGVCGQRMRRLCRSLPALTAA
jgi:hypothetical protein